MGAVHRTGAPPVPQEVLRSLDNEVETPDPTILPMIVNLAKMSDKNANAAKEATARLRAIDLRDVLRAAGLEPSKRDKARWVGDEERFAITVEGTRWFDQRADKGRGGAIDLVQHLLACDFATARAWLASRFDAGRSSRTKWLWLKRKPRQNLPPPSPSSSFCQSLTLKTGRR